MGVSQIKGTILGVPITRVIIFWGLCLSYFGVYIGVLDFGKLPSSNRKYKCMHDRSKFVLISQFTTASNVSRDFTAQACCWTPRFSGFPINGLANKVFCCISGFLHSGAGSTMPWSIIQFPAPPKGPCSYGAYLHIYIYIRIQYRV